MIRQWWLLHATRSCCLLPQAREVSQSRSETTHLEGCSEGLGVAGSETAAETAAASASLSRRCRSASRYSDSSLPFRRTLEVVSIERGVRPDIRARWFLVNCRILCQSTSLTQAGSENSNMHPPSLFSRIAMIIPNLQRTKKGTQACTGRHVILSRLQRMHFTN